MDLNPENPGCSQCHYYGPNVRLIVGSGFQCTDCTPPIDCEKHYCRHCKGLTQHSFNNGPYLRCEECGRIHS